VRRMAIECPTRRLLNVTFFREIVEPKPSDGTQQQSRHLTQSARHPQGESMIDRTIPEARRVATKLGVAGLEAARAICGAATRDLDLHWSELLFSSDLSLALAASLLTAALGMDTGDSVRNPASMCAITGHAASSAATACFRSPPRSTTSAP
jgi:hypothetical protein